MFSYPVRSAGASCAIVEGIQHDDFARAKLATTEQELLDERNEVRELLGT